LAGIAVVGRVRPMMTLRRSRRRWQLPLLAVASTLLALGLLEAISRLVADFSSPLQPLRVGAIQLYGRHDPLLFWSLSPGARDAEGRHWINDQGLRGPEIGDKEPGEYRILSLGESTTFAAQVPYADSYSAVLEALFDVPGARRRVRVLNAGVPGYSLFQGIQYLTKRSAPLRPDMVLLYFGFNDFLPVAYLAERVGPGAKAPGGRNDSELFGHRHQPAQRFVSFLLEWSNLVRGLSELATGGSDERLHQNSKRPRVPRRHRVKLLEVAKRYADKHGIELVIVVPIYAHFDRHAPLLREFASSESVPIVDLPTLLGATFLDDADVNFVDTVHPSSRGHRKIAVAIHGVVEPLVSR
jgi:lysophospholipase L1-like esterase